MSRRKQLFGADIGAASNSGAAATSFSDNDLLCIQWRKKV